MKVFPVIRDRFRRSIISAIRGTKLFVGLLDRIRGAVAAYSLNRLTFKHTSDPVVRIRRTSDSKYRDFTANDIETGVMTNWVNATVALPLDKSDAAEYAYSTPRRLRADYDGPLLQARRELDGAVKDFTDVEIHAGELEEWASGTTLTLSKLYHQNNSTLHLTSPNPWNEPILVQDGILQTLPSNPNILAPRYERGKHFSEVRDEANALLLWIGPEEDSPELPTDSETFLVAETENDFTYIPEILLYPNSASAFFTPIRSNIGDYYNIDVGDNTNLESVDAFLHTLYDQSGNARDLTQSVAANQPQIVQDGSLIPLSPIISTLVYSDTAALERTYLPAINVRTFFFFVHHTPDEDKTLFSINSNAGSVSILNNQISIIGIPGVEVVINGDPDIGNVLTEGWNSIGIVQPGGSLISNIALVAHIDSFVLYEEEFGLNN